jgi:hypothetical protein
MADLVGHRSHLRPCMAESVDIKWVLKWRVLAPVMPLFLGRLETAPVTSIHAHIHRGTLVVNWRRFRRCKVGLNRRSNKKIIYLEDSETVQVD